MFPFEYSTGASLVSGIIEGFKMIRHIQSPGIVRMVYSSIFKDLEGYLMILMHLQPHSGIIIFAKHLALNAWHWICLRLDNCSAISVVTLCYVLHQTHSEFCYIQNSFFRYVQTDSSIFRIIEVYPRILGIIKENSGLFRHIQNPMQPSQFRNLGLFWTLAYLDPQA